MPYPWTSLNTQASSESCLFVYSVAVSFMQLEADQAFLIVPLEIGGHFQIVRLPMGV